MILDINNKPVCPSVDWSDPAIPKTKDDAKLDQALKKGDLQKAELVYNAIEEYTKDFFLPDW